MFFLSDRSVKASVPWYSNWKETLMELNTSTFYSGIFLWLVLICQIALYSFSMCPIHLSLPSATTVQHFPGRRCVFLHFFPLTEKSLVVVVLIFLLITFLLLLIKIIWSFHTISKGGGGKLPDGVKNTGLLDPMELYTVTVLYFKCTFSFSGERLSQGTVTLFKLELNCWLYLGHICLCYIDILSGVWSLKKEKAL